MYLTKTLSKHTINFIKIFVQVNVKEIDVGRIKV
jgi:hypothetical protein